MPGPSSTSTSTAFDRLPGSGSRVLPWHRLLHPLFDYLTERVGEESSILYVLERYVHLVEWFDRKDLHARAMQDSRKSEDVYDAHLRRFLFGEGINMPFSQAQSASGESDVLTDLDTSDPLVCEVKLFDSDRGKRHLASGVHQALSYASDYGKQVAYLVIINLSGRPLTLPSDDDTKPWPPRITVAGTLVYLIAVRALPPVASASKLGKPAPVIITRDLVDPDVTDESDSHPIRLRPRGGTGPILALLGRPAAHFDTSTWPMRSARISGKPSP